MLIITYIAPELYCKSDNNQEKGISKICNHYKIGF